MIRPELHKQNNGQEGCPLSASNMPTRANNNPALFSKDPATAVLRITLGQLGGGTLHNFDRFRQME